MTGRPPRKPVQVNWVAACSDTDALVILDDDLEGYVTVADRSASTGALYGHRSIAPGPGQADILAAWRKDRAVVIDRRGDWVDVSPWLGRVGPPAD